MICIPPAYAVNKTHVIVYNGLAKCIQAWPVKRYEQGDLLIIKTAFTLKEMLGKCRCSSDSIYYAGLLPEKTITASLLNPNSFLQQGYISLDRSKVMDLVLSSDLGIVRGKGLALYLRCRRGEEK